MTSKPRRLSACHRHPSVPVTGFCALCLRERLAGIDSNGSPSPPDLRRSKSCSRPTTAVSASEPRRRSCEVRPRSSLSDLFSLDDNRRARHRNPNPNLNLGSGLRIEHEIRVCELMEGEDEETKTVKEFIDLELQRRKKSSGRDSRTFWNAFSERLRKWKWKHKLKKNADGDANKSFQKKGLRDTQSEIGECNLGRRSCDTDPRLSIDAGRISMDCPRASWDGCLIGKACPRLSPMVSLAEDSNDSNRTSDSVNLENVENGGRSFGAESFDRSNSRRRQSISEIDELKLMSNANANAKVSPATFYGAKLLITEKELMDNYVKKSSSDVVVQSDCVLESDYKGSSDVASGVRQKGFGKLRKWCSVWNKLGLVQRKEDKLGEEESDSRVVIDKPLGESLHKLRRVVNVQSSEPIGPKLMRSYSVSCRSPCRVDGFVNGVVEEPESKGNGLNGRQEFMFQRNRSVRYSPSTPDTGLLRFYLTPSKSYRRNKSGRGSLKDLHSIARNGL